MTNTADKANEYLREIATAQRSETTSLYAVLSAGAAVIIFLALFVR